ncbi:hypothetical protein [Polaribacter tangerinus]|uniref:hypothetical protein n=1 Tax=Polaribacter tangerinus TaxID=1920034 RepID=UPI000B4BE5C8|nr:hypothetical protein [Polaribacter tangerinus]
MKKIASIIVFAFVVVTTTNAQQKRNVNRPVLSVAQQTDLTVKRMTLALDLSEKQQEQLKPVIEKNVSERVSFLEKNKEARKERKKPSANEMYAFQSKMLDGKIAMKNSLKKILNKEQLKKFEKMKKPRRERAMRNIRKGQKNKQRN